MILLNLNMENVVINVSTIGTLTTQSLPICEHGATLHLIVPFYCIQQYFIVFCMEAFQIFFKDLCLDA